MFLDDMDSIDFDLVHYAVNEDKIFLSQHRVITFSWCQHPRDNESNKPFIESQATY